MESSALIHSSSFSVSRFTDAKSTRFNSTTLIITIFPIHITNSFTPPRRSLLLLAKAACKNHNHNHQHCCSVELTVSNHPQKLLIAFPKAIGWIRLSNFLREHHHLCCSSAAIFLAAAVSPHFIPKPYIIPIQYTFMIIAFPHVGISASLDALMDIAGGKVNIHVLMALAAFASVFMGNTLEEGLLLTMFNLAHIKLKESNPNSALVIDVNNDNVPNFFDLSYKSVHVHNVEVESYRGGQVLDSLPSCHIIAFDKTGTLTTSGLTCKATEPIYGHHQSSVTPCCMPNCEKEAMEKGTIHPIGRAMVDHNVGKDLPYVSVESF
ncbi:putative cadmium/zinc-transporting ATPase HMA1 [Cardamine amara subsp. amara]|uniref:Cadmium/zinc-transporting ATPase HMA1 n=1 Tax=Cardamine amara subsp. amara TaxID=228776 RepID=A0ABD1BPF2_CARAN